MALFRLLAKHIILICVFVLSLMVVFAISAWLRQAALYGNYRYEPRIAPETETEYEPFSVLGLQIGSSPSASEVSAMSVATRAPTGIASMDMARLDGLPLPLSQLCVKGAFNAACSGTNISTDALGVILSRGCRFLDFEVFLVDGAARVGVSSTYVSGRQNITSRNTILLSDALASAAVYGFTAPAPNPGDPLFLHLRLNLAGTDAAQTGFFRLVAMSIRSAASARLYTGAVDARTDVRDLLGKVVIMLDRNCAAGYTSEPQLRQLVNIESGGSVLRSYTYGALLDQYTTPPEVDADAKSTTATMLRMVVPDAVDATGSNPDFAAFVRDYGVQFVPMRYYVRDARLAAYEAFFANFNSGMVRFAECVPFIRGSGVEYETE